jgi:cytoskeletal protein RodZ
VKFHLPREPEGIVSIGEVLSDARSRCALTIENVSYLTRIRERVIRDIEHDDFRSCGGDFYARGHIRAIADVVNIDSVPLIEEFDALRQAHPRDEAPVLKTWRTPDPTGRDEHRRERHQQRSRERDRNRERNQNQNRSRERHQDRDREPNPNRRHDRSPVPWIAAICLVVLAIFGWGIYNVAHVGRHSSETAAQAAYGRTASPQAKSSGHAKTSPGSPSPASSPTTAAPLQTIKPVKATAYGPNGITGDDPQAAYEAIDASGTTRWRSDWYSTPAFGNTQSGTGLLLDLGKTATIDAATITIGTPGASIDLKAGNDPSHLQLIGHAKNAAATAVIHPEEISARYILVWFTQLPPDTDGTYRATVYNIALQGQP